MNSKRKERKEIIESMQYWYNRITIYSVSDYGIDHNKWRTLEVKDIVKNVFAVKVYYKDGRVSKYGFDAIATLRIIGKDIQYIKVYYYDGTTEKMNNFDWISLTTSTNGETPSSIKAKQELSMSGDIGD